MNEQNSQQNEGGARTAAMDNTKEALHGLEAYLVPIFEKFPHIPEGGRKFIVDVAPYIALIFGILGIVALVGASGLGMVATLLSFGYALPMMVHILISLAAAVILLMAYPGLKARVKKGWNFVFYSQVVSIGGGIVSILLGNIGGIVGLVIGALIGFYILFEVRGYYR